MMWKLCVTVVSLLVAGLAATDKYKRVCYFTNWSQYRTGEFRFTVANITDPSLCTHYIFAFSKVLPDQETLGPYESNDEGPGGNYEQLTDLKKKNPGLKILLGVGGWLHGSMPFVDIVSNDTKVFRFCDNVVKYLRDRNFDGLDLDWEYPAHRGSNDSDRERFTFLAEKLMEKFKEEAASSGKPRLLLSSAVPCGKDIIEKGYEVEKLARVYDFINLMSYDLDVFREGLYYNAPMYARPDDKPPNDTINVHSNVELWVSSGMPREKIVLGIPMYARQYTVMDGSRFMYGEPMKVNSTIKTTWTQQICERLSLPQEWTLSNDTVAMAAVMHNDAIWINYEAIWTIDIKVNYIKDKGLGGFMIWELSLDDFGGENCNRGRYPMLSLLSQLMTSSKDAVPNESPRIGCSFCASLVLFAFMGYEMSCVL